MPEVKPSDIQTFASIKVVGVGGAGGSAVPPSESLPLADAVAVAVPDVIDKVMDYGREIANAAVCEAAYDKVTAKMHRKEAGDTLAEITAMLAAAPEKGGV
jgi:hypothetical protein